MKVEIPTNCPVCNSTLELVNNQLFCRNNSCSAKSSKQLLHYVKTMKIMGLGEKTLEKLNLDKVKDLYTLEEDVLVEKLGQKIGTKIYSEIQNSTQSTITKFLSSMSIPLIGKTAAEKIDNTVTELGELTKEVCKKAGLGPKATDNLMNWFESEYEDLKLLPIEFDKVADVESGITVCISGKIPGYTKSKLKEYLADFNVSVVDNVTKSIDYLITEESNTSKVKKAEQYNINIISFDKFMEIIENE
jgi:NAD-dependent DNA ligase